MSVGYEVLADAVSVLISRGEIRTADGELLGYDHESKIYTKGEVVPGDEISPLVAQSYDDGDPYTTSIFQKVSSSGETSEIDESKKSAPKKTGTSRKKPEQSEE